MNLNNTTLQCPGRSFSCVEFNAALWKVLSDRLGDMSPRNLPLVPNKPYDVNGLVLTCLFHSLVVKIGTLSKKFNIVTCAVEKMKLT